MAWRSLAKNKVSSFINIGGLSVGLATGIIILLVIADEFSYDKFNRNLADIHLIMKNQDMAGDIQTGTVTPSPLAPVLRKNIPELKLVARTSQESNELYRVEDKSLYERTLFAEPDFLSMMTFPAIAGDPVTALKHPGAAVITETAARKFFGTASPLGKLLQLNNDKALRVEAVIRDVPDNSSNKFDILLSYSLYEALNPWTIRWDNHRVLTWVQLQPNTNLASLDKKLSTLFVASQEEKNMSLFAYAFAQMRLYSRFRNGKPAGGVIDIVQMLSVIGSFVLLIACINFMNLATARTERRAREVGVRKVLGATRKSVILQFMCEAMLLALIALLIGVVLANLALPGFMLLTGKNFNPDFYNPGIWTALLSLGIATGLVAGSYPALFLSRFKPVNVLKGRISLSGGGTMLRKALVSFQFMISIFLMIATLVFYQQIAFVQKRAIGYDPSNLLDIPARGNFSDHYAEAKNRLSVIPGVLAVTAANDNLSEFGGAFNGLDWPGKTKDQDFYITMTTVHYDWSKTTGLQFFEGRDFSPAFGTDSNACLINQAAAKRMHLREPIVGTMLGKNKVIGVLTDFVFNDVSKATSPLIVYLDTKSANHLLVRIANNDQWKQCVADIEKMSKQFNPGFPFEFRFARDEYQQGFQNITALGRMANVFGAMAIFISCLGLFGLSAFLAERRSKELGIRKVLGASVAGLWYSLSKDFIKPVFIAFAIAAPLTALVMDKILSRMDYRIHLAPWMFMLGALLAVVIALATVSVNGLKAAKINPAKSLRSE